MLVDPAGADPERRPAPREDRQFIDRGERAGSGVVVGRLTRPPDLRIEGIDRAIRFEKFWGEILAGESMLRIC